MSNYNEDMKKMLRDLKNEILSKYDSSDEIKVRVNLLPKAHNSMSDTEKVVKPEEGMKVITNEHNRHNDPVNVVIHETTPGKTKFMPEGIETEYVERPTKPAFHSAKELYKEDVTEEERKEMYSKNRSTEYYDKLVRNQGYNEGHGRTIAYHARIDYPEDDKQGMIGQQEIVIIMPATASPDQVSNRNVTPYVYGIERCVGDEQNYHLAIANQAMLTAFVLKEIGYDTDTAMKHIFPHNFFDKNKGACPARMLYASYLVEKINNRGMESLTEEERENALDDIKEYVPWEVFMGLVKEFFERDRFPEELQKKFIYDMSDYDAYMQNPSEYDYRERRALKPQRIKRTLDIKGEEYAYPDPTTIHFKKVDISDIKIEKNKDEEER